MTLVVSIIVILILGLAAWGVNNAPFIAPQFKQIASFLLIVVAVIVAIYFLLGLIGVSHTTLNLR